MRRSGRVVKRQTLMLEIYGIDDEIQPHALTILVSRLRNRLDDADAGVDIHSARGVGYVITKRRTCRSFVRSPTGWSSRCCCRKCSPFLATWILQVHICAGPNRHRRRLRLRFRAPGFRLCRGARRRDGVARRGCDRRDRDRAVAGLAGAAVCDADLRICGPDAGRPSSARLVAGAGEGAERKRDARDALYGIQRRRRRALLPARYKGEAEDQVRTAVYRRLWL
ncbi:helix-turn-helix domain-containing protein [Methylocapsa aurea]|uniref:helix-turn-helix domain-containing protein n=1 Tax=Methylocapsa aurea TaxID=663610 RepID=UPI003D18ECDA